MNHIHNYYRNINGILLLDKPIGISSNKSLQIVKKIFQVKKAGHTGTLDPLATGMLLICLGEATKLAQYAIVADKYYRVTAKLGQRTNTSDSNGLIIKVRPVFLNQDILDKELAKFNGNIIQVPSQFSAIKYKGKPLFYYALKGIKVPILPRKICIYKIKLRYWNQSIIEIDIHCSKGTYIRTIIDDLGENLGCGAHVIALRRLQIGHFYPKFMIKLEKLQSIIIKLTEKNNLEFKKINSFLLPIESIISYMPIIKLNSFQSKCIRFGQILILDIPISNIKINSLVRLIETKSKKNYFIGIGKLITKVNIKPHRVMTTNISSYYN